MNSQINRLSLQLFGAFAAVSMAAVLMAFVLEFYLLLLVPAGLVLTYLAVIDYRNIFYLLIFTLPLSTEIQFSNGIGTDLPSEPLMVALLAIFVILMATKSKLLEYRFVRHPLIVLLLLHYGWMLFALLHSSNYLVSGKFMLAKSWYIAVFVFLTAMIVKDVKDFRKLFWLMYIPLFFAVSKVFLQQMLEFSLAFENVNEVTAPFFRNHVTYAAMTTAFFPFLFPAARWYEKGSWKRLFINFGKVLFLVAIYFSYTRACYLALITIAICYLIIRYKMMKWLLRATVLATFVLISWLVYNNNYLRFSPEFQETIYHKDFSKHLEATYKLQDVSSMERLYRWVAAFYMAEEKPWTGYGPGNFYPFYKRHTVSEFTTYVSENEEKSTVHNYFLLVLVEQGIIGLIIFFVLTIALFRYGERIYHAQKDPHRKALAMGLILSLITAYVNLMMSDMIEVDKTGSLFFICIAMLVNLSIYNPDKKQVELSDNLPKRNGSSAE